MEGETIVGHPRRSNVLVVATQKGDQPRMSVTHLEPAGHYTPGGAYSHAVRVGDLLFVAGQVAKNPPGGEVVGEGDITAQTTQVLENLRAVLEACGSSLDLIAKVVIYTVDIDYRTAITEVERRFFTPGRYPTSTFLVVKSLADPRLLVEIEAIAGLRDSS